MSSYCVMDFETTGTKPKTDRVIEIAALKVVNDVIVAQFNVLIANGPVVPKITEITGITNADLLNGLDEETGFRMLNRIIGDSAIICHNAPFDLAFLHEGLMRHAGRTFTNDFYDTLTICRERYSYPHKLTDMCERLGIELTGAHRALNDVFGTWRLFNALGGHELVEWKNKLAFMKKYGPNAWYPENAIVYGIDLK